MKTEDNIGGVELPPKVAELKRICEAKEAGLSRIRDGKVGIGNILPAIAEVEELVRQSAVILRHSNKLEAAPLGPEMAAALKRLETAEKAPGSYSRMDAMTEFHAAAQAVLASAKKLPATYQRAQGASVKEEDENGKKS